MNLSFLTHYQKMKLKKHLHNPEIKKRLKFMYKMFLEIHYIISQLENNTEQTEDNNKKNEV